MWHTQTAAVTGSGHARQGLPCQDRTGQLTEGGVTAIALADGAGSQPLSQEGAAIAVETVCRTLCRRFDQLYAAATPMEMRREVLREVRENIRAHAAARGMEPGQFACTLLAVAVRGDRYLLVHVGDGVIAYQKNGALLAASRPENGEFANTTTFVTSAGALRWARVLRGEQPGLEGFLLMSDGCEAALYQKRQGTVAPLVGRLFQRAELLEPEISGALLQAVLEQAVAPRTRDDCSLAVMTRQGPAFTPWERMQPRQQAAVLGVATGNRNRRRRAVRRYARAFGAK